MTLKSATIFGGSATAGTVALDQPAPSGGVNISLRALDPKVAETDPNVVVPEGATSATFTVKARAVTADSATTIVAARGSQTQSASLTVTAVVIRLVSLTLKPDSVRGGQNAQGTLTLSDPAPAEGIKVALASDNAGRHRS